MHAIRRRLAVLGALLTLASAAAAQSEPAFPSKPLQLVVTVPPGGAADFVGRMIGAKLSDDLGQPVIVVNRGGASGTIATESVAKAKADGYTLLLNAISTHGIGPHLFKTLPYDPLKDFAPIGLVAKVPLIMTISDQVPAKTIAELISLAKAQPGKLSFATPGRGGAPHLAAELFMSVTGAQLLHVPYKGSGPAVIDVAAGRVHMMFDGAPALWPHLQSGKLVPLAAMSAERNRLLGNVPTFAELGFQGMEMYLWYGLVAPAGISNAVQQKLSAALAKALRSTSVLEAFAKQSIDVGGGSPEQFAAFMREEHDRWGRVVRKAGIEPE